MRIYGCAATDIRHTLHISIASHTVSGLITLKNVEGWLAVYMSATVKLSHDINVGYSCSFGGVIPGYVYARKLFLAVFETQVLPDVSLVHVIVGPITRPPLTGSKFGLGSISEC